MWVNNSQNKGADWNGRKLLDRIIFYSIDQVMVRVRNVKTATDAEGCVNEILFKPFILLTKNSNIVFNF